MKRKLNVSKGRSGNERVANVLLRLAMGVNLFAHGLARLPQIADFRDWMTGLFEDAMIPLFAVKIFSTVLPFAEIIIGVLLIAGLFTRYALIVGTCLMICLIGGSCLIEKWEFAGTQMLYMLLYYILIKHLSYNCLAIDKRWKSEK